MGSFGLYGTQNVSFIDLETGKKINIDNASVSIEDEKRNYNNSKLNFKNMNLKDKTFVCELPYINKKKLYNILYGITNNYRRLHGGHALREVTRRRYIMKKKDKQEKER